VTAVDHYRPRPDTTAQRLTRAINWVVDKGTPTVVAAIIPAIAITAVLSGNDFPRTTHQSFAAPTTGLCIQAAAVIALLVGIAVAGLAHKRGPRR
jgi:hypothetical protein